MLYLVRHAKAGTRYEWDGDDELRPLTKSGKRQAAAIARRLAKKDTTTLISSPYLRCVQTLEPLAHLQREPVHIDDRLAEGSGFPAVMELFAALPDGAVLCSHGDTIPEVIDALGAPRLRVAVRARLAQGDRVGAAARRRRVHLGEVLAAARRRPRLRRAQISRVRRGRVRRVA